MLGRFSRTELLLGDEAMKKLENSRVAVFGVGGVGGYTVEALARSGVGTIDIIDDDKVCLTNINRQIIALTSTIGKYKVDVAEERIKDINPKITVNKYKMFFFIFNSNPQSYRSHLSQHLCFCDHLTSFVYNLVLPASLLSH